GAGQDALVQGAAVDGAAEAGGERLDGGGLVHHAGVARRLLVPRPDPPDDVVDAVQVEGVDGGVPAGQVGGVQVPALVEAVPQRVPDVRGVRRPRRVDLVGAVVAGDDVGGAVRQPHAGAGERHLHGVPGEVAGGVVEALLVRRQPDRGGVVEHPEVGGGEAAR